MEARGQRLRCQLFIGGSITTNHACLVTVCQGKRERHPPHTPPAPLSRRYFVMTETQTANKSTWSRFDRRCRAAGLQRQKLQDNSRENPPFIHDAQHMRDSYSPPNKGAFNCGGGAVRAQRLGEALRRCSHSICTRVYVEAKPRLPQSG